MAEPLPTLLNEHTWSTIKNVAGKTHHLIPVGSGELLDWTEQTGDYAVWMEGALTPTNDPFPTARTFGSFSSIRTGHDLVFLADTPGDWWAGNVLDWQPASLGVRIWRLDRSIGTGDPMPTKLNQSSFTTIGAGHTLIYLDHDRILDWEPSSGRSRVWSYDRARTTTDPLPTKVTEFTWATIRTGHQLVYLGGDLMLDWEEATGVVRIWRYDRTATGSVDPLPTKEMEGNWSGKIAAGHRLQYLGGDRVLDWDPATGHERIWDFDRPKMPAAAFQAMLDGDVGTAVTWVTSAQAALAGYQAGLLSGIHDLQWQATDFALDTHFHAQTHGSGVQAALSVILDTYNKIFVRLTTDTASIQQSSKAQSVTDLGGLANYTRGYTQPSVYTRLSPAYRPFDTIGNLGLDGAGDKLRAAIVIHETTHFVGNNPDSAAEWEDTYDTLTAEQAVTNPSSYAAFAHHVLTGTDLRFGNEPWQ